MELKKMRITAILFGVLISSWGFSQELSKETRIDSVSVFFNFGSSTPKDKSALMKRINALGKNLTGRIRLISYTDTVGGLDANRKLGSKRLISIMDLISKTNLRNFATDTLNMNERHRGKLLTDEEYRRVDLIIYRIDMTFVYDQPINLKIQFQNATDVLLTGAYNSLNTLYYILQQDPTLKIQLNGHVCCTPHYELSLKRAERAKNYLVKKGIDPARITCVGYDNKVKLVEETSPANEAINRRVEVVFIKNELR
ncbi:OmpA family protein [Fluviicola sp.]|jgi:outer membrane protein OmpA-like peptidoglycan-associated protein|uniref:OmpA family protein n=1 Tax=Fluviicola sp. TaxID=1917219 RepID=UPI002828B386|nr:OmpA family protein [Fluviicola sp.]MDR0803255.1 OmpA family protein [Fluviicola sp.]